VNQSFTGRGAGRIAPLAPSARRAARPGRCAPGRLPGKLPPGRSTMTSGLDHGEVIHHAGQHARSPALVDGAPALLARGEPGRRVGWQEFFEALSARGEGLVLASDGGCRTAPLASIPGPSRPSAPAEFLHRASATLRALRGQAP